MSVSGACSAEEGVDGGPSLDLDPCVVLSVLFLRFCRTCTKRYLIDNITSPTRVKRVEVVEPASSEAGPGRPDGGLRRTSAASGGGVQFPSAGASGSVMQT